MDTEIIIAGGGLVGNALAIALSHGGIRSTVIDPLPRAAQIDAAFDGRTSAISSGSVRILTHLGAWQHIAPHAQPIHDIRVCDQDKPGFVHYSDKDVGEPFGYIVENNLLRRGLYMALEAAPHVRVIHGKVTGFTRAASSITAQLESGDLLTAPLLIAADGRFSKLRAQAGLAHRVISYDQTAIVCVIEHDEPHHGLALEKFYPAGPFAALPLKPTADGVNRSGIVWTESEADAAQYVALSDNEFNAEIQRRLGDAASGYWGEARAIGKRFSYPLKLMHADSFIAERFALVGDAAHGIHPIAGQGVNLGYRDVAALSELLIAQHRLGLDLGSPSVLARYQRWRKFDSVTMTASTDLLNRLFSNNLPGMSLIRRAGMVAVNRMPPLKHYFMRHAMGLIGDLPKMMRDDKAA
ncbi:MAG: UbiH/UbiF/VisC/COQ6 family ubiquinone biosynthesis hydroxylase [Pseudomonadota bacterium]